MYEVPNANLSQVVSLSLSLDAVATTHASGVVAASSLGARDAMSAHQFPTLRHVLRGINHPNVTGTGSLIGYNATISPFSIQGISASDCEMTSPTVVIINTTEYVVPASSVVPDTASGTPSRPVTFSTANGTTVVSDSTVL